MILLDVIKGAIVVYVLGRGLIIKD